MKTKNNYTNILIALITTNNISEAAKLAGVSTRTINNYTKDPEFKKQFQKLQSSFIQLSCLKISDNMILAIDTLKDIIKNKNTPINLKINATKNILDYGIKLIEIYNIS